jgi:hypothetical protein
MGINHKYNHITNHTQLMYTIMQVNAARAEQEDEIKHQVKEIYYSLQPATLIKNAVENVLHSPETRKSLTQMGLAMGTDFLISKFFKRGTSLKGFFSAMAVEKIADYALNSKSDFIQSGIGKIGNLLKKFTERA